MPSTFNPSQLHAMVATLIEDNDENLISASDARTVLDAIIDSFYNLVSTPNPTAPSLENVLLEGNVSGATDIFINTGRFLLFQGPGTGIMRIRPVQYTGPQPPYTDIVFQAKPGTLALLSDIIESTWLKPVNGVASAPTGAEANGTRYIVAIGATGAFSGHDNDIAEKVDGGWTFKGTYNGDMVRSLADSNGVIKSKEAGVWVTPVGALSLAAVLGIGNSTGGHVVEVTEDDAIAFVQGAFASALKVTTLSANRALFLPDLDGVLCTEAKAAFYADGAQAAAQIYADANKLDIDQNLIDLSDVSAARDNLGLGKLAVKDYAQALIDEDFITEAAHGFTVYTLVALVGTTWVKADMTDEQHARVVGMVIEVSGTDRFRLLRKGRWNNGGAFPVGTQLFLDDSVPGELTQSPSVNGYVVPVIRQEPGGLLEFNPGHVVSGTIVSGATDTTNSTYGAFSDSLTFIGELGATYRVRLDAIVSTNDVGNSVSVAITTSGVIFSTISSQVAMDGTCVVQNSNAIGILTQPTPIPDRTDMVCVVEATVTLDVSSSHPIGVKYGSNVTGQDVSLKAGSRLTWTRIN